jgi:hypothetical protein
MMINVNFITKILTNNIEFDIFEKFFFITGEGRSF